MSVQAIIPFLQGLQQFGQPKEKSVKTPSINPYTVDNLVEAAKVIGQGALNAHPYYGQNLMRDRPMPQGTVPGFDPYQPSESFLNEAMQQQVFNGPPTVQPQAQIQQPMLPTPQFRPQVQAQAPVQAMDLGGPPPAVPMGTPMPPQMGEINMGERPSLGANILYGLTGGLAGKNRVHHDGAVLRQRQKDVAQERELQMAHKFQYDTMVSAGMDPNEAAIASAQSMYAPVMAEAMQANMDIEAAEGAMPSERARAYFENMGKEQAAKTEADFAKRKAQDVAGAQRAYKTFQQNQRNILDQAKITGTGLQDPANQVAIIRQMFGSPQGLGGGSAWDPYTGEIIHPPGSVDQEGVATVIPSDIPGMAPTVVRGVDPRNVHMWNQQGKQIPLVPGQQTRYPMTQEEFDRKVGRQ